MRKVWTGSEGEESEGGTNDWKWSGAVVARVWKRDGVQARAGSRYPGHQQWLWGKQVVRVWREIEGELFSF